MDIQVHLLCVEAVRVHGTDQPITIVKLSKQDPGEDHGGREGLDKDWKVHQGCSADIWLEPQTAALLPTFPVHLDVFPIPVQKRLEVWWFLL